MLLSLLRLNDNHFHQEEQEARNRRSPGRTKSVLGYQFFSIKTNTMRLTTNNGSRACSQRLISMYLLSLAALAFILTLSAQPLDGASLTLGNTKSLAARDRGKFLVLFILD